MPPSSNPPRSTVPRKRCVTLDARGVSPLTRVRFGPASNIRDTALLDGTTSRFAKSWTISNNQKHLTCG
ncbi:hypothetical protein KCP74_12365 [Salmonella enterica subsp. enterica]|nr:hypothetical protein KCP74_12365 [Salmonella enterica subsp. enterica]